VGSIPFFLKFYDLEESKQYSVQRIRLTHPFCVYFVQKSFPLVFKSEHMLYLSLLNDIDYKFKIYFGLEKLEYSY